MRSGRILLSTMILTFSLVAALPLLAAPARRSPTAQRANAKHSKTSVKKASQTGIDPARATELQTALIKYGYLSGPPSGTWDAQTQAAMQKLQADNGWQTKLVPDSRAIIKLGLGPAQDNIASLQSTTAVPTPSTY
jgi:Putative peptidoglycan binding domain